MSDKYYIEFLEPDADLNKALDELGKSIGVLYQEAWDKHKRHLYSDKPFDLNINAFANAWFAKAMKVFVVRDTQTQESIGFLVGTVFRPLPYSASVFQIQEWYVRGADEMGQELFDFVTNAIRIIGCDELWISTYSSQTIPNLNWSWTYDRDFPIRRYIRKR